MIQGQFYTTIKVQQPYNKAVFFYFIFKIVDNFVEKINLIWLYN